MRNYIVFYFRRALLLLKKKKCQEKLLEQSERNLATVEGLINDLEFAQVEVQVLDSLKKGNEALKQLNALMKLDDVEKILSDAQDAQDYQAVSSQFFHFIYGAYLLFRKFLQIKSDDVGAEFLLFLMTLKTHLCKLLGSLKFRSSEIQLHNRKMCIY